MNETSTAERSLPRAHPAELPGPLSPPGRVALVGAGGFGQFCLDAYRRAGDFDVVAVADPRLAGGSVESHPHLIIEADWHSAIENPAVEALHLATPPYLRGDIALAAMRAGKSVLCEKPLALSLAEADDMLRVARETGRAIGINYVMRHHPAFLILHRLADSGVLGSVRTIALQNFAQSLPADHWMWDLNQSGGILVEHGVHFFDAYGQVVGAPLEIRAVAPRREAIAAVVRYAGGAVGTYYHEFSFPVAVERTHGTVFFDRGYVEIDGWIPERLHGKALCDAATFRQALGDLGGLCEYQQEGEVLHFAAAFDDRQEAYRRSIVAGMRDLIARHRDPAYRMTVSPEDARASLALALAGQSAARGETAGTVANDHG